MVSHDLLRTHTERNNTIGNPRLVTGSDLAHLVKATYYVTARLADQQINAIRPTLYDPRRPPAASKLSVRGTGRKGKASTFDMIAVTVK